MNHLANACINGATPKPPQTRYQTVAFEPFVVLLFAIISVRGSWHASGLGVRKETIFSLLSAWQTRRGRVPTKSRERDSMVRSARILRVTRVAARLDCLQRLSNARIVQEKQTHAANWCEISCFALCRFVSRVCNHVNILGILKWKRHTQFTSLICVLSPCTCYSYRSLTISV